MECTLGAVNRIDKVGGSSSKQKPDYGLEMQCKVIEDYVYLENPTLNSLS